MLSNDVYQGFDYRIALSISRPSYYKVNSWDWNLWFKRPTLEKRRYLGGVLYRLT